MPLSKQQEEIWEGIEERLRGELLDNRMRIAVIKIEDVDDEEMSTVDKVKKFMEETTERTDKKTNVIGTTELWEKYIEWNYNENKKTMKEGDHMGTLNGKNRVLTSNVMGKILTDLLYKKHNNKVEGKQTRGFGYLKYKSEADNSISVKEYMEKYTERTNSLKDRIVIKKLLPRFYDEYPERYGQEVFIKKLNRYGYHTKPAKEIQKTRGKYGNEVLKKVGEPVQCVLKVALRPDFYKNYNEAWGLI
jgi:DNA-directed RNA polymerase specialized sigma54-like protein